MLNVISFKQIKSFKKIFLGGLLSLALILGSFLSFSATKVEALGVLSGGGSGTLGGGSGSLGTSGGTLATTYITDGTVHGYAWSSNIGWLNLNCAEGGASGANTCSTSNYAVTLEHGPSDPTIYMVGYAWSSNIGWVYFNDSSSPTSTNACGSSPIYDSTTHKFSGFAQAYSAISSTTSGWDGCISLAKLGSSSINYGVTVDMSGHMSGKAWEATSIGWLDFSYATITFGALGIDFRINGESGHDTSSTAYNLPPTGGTATLSYSTTGAMSSCVSLTLPAQSTWSPVSTDWTSGTMSPLGSTATVTVPAYSSSLSTIQYVVTCVPADGSPNVSSTIYVKVADPSAPYLTLNANHLFVDSGATMPITLTWTALNMLNTTACTTSSLSGSGAGSFETWDGAGKPSSTTSTGGTFNYITSTPLTTSETFTISCVTPLTTSGPGGGLSSGGGSGLGTSSYVSQTASVTIGINSPSCKVVPATAMTVANSSGVVSGSQAFRVEWDHAPYRSSTINIGTIPSGYTLSATRSTTSALTTATSTNTISVSATAFTSTSPKYIPITAAPLTPYTVSGVTISSCTPAQYKIAPYGTVTGMSTKLNYKEK